MSKSRRIAGTVDPVRGYLWRVGQGSWIFDPVDGPRTLTICHETDGTIYPVRALKFTRAGDDLRIEVPGQDHHLLLKGWYRAERWYEAGAGPSWRIDEIQYRSGNLETAFDVDFPWMRFSDLVPVDPPDLAGGAAVTEHRSIADDEAGRTAMGSGRTIAGDEQNNVLEGTEGDDRIFTDVGQDRVCAGGGNDLIVVAHHEPDTRAPDNKSIRGGRGRDTVDYGGAFGSTNVGIDASLKSGTVKWGQSGRDQLFGIENIRGTVAADRFEGNARNNVMTGSRGNDVYLVTRGGGEDVILDEDSTMGNVDTIRFGPGIRREDLGAHTSGEDVVVELLGDGGQIDTVVTIERGTQTAFTIERLELHDGTRFKWEDLAAPTADPSPVEAWWQADEAPSVETITPDPVRGDGRATTLCGTSGDDRLKIDDRHDKVMTGLGDDQVRVHHGQWWTPKSKEIRGGRGNDTVDYRDAFGAEGRGVGVHASLETGTVTWEQGGKDRLFGIENVGGTDAADLFEGNAGNNVMTGYRGNDVYRVTLGGGRDEILDQDDTENNRDTLLFGAGIRLDLLLKRTEGPDLVIQVMREDGQFDTRITIRNGTQPGFAIERFVLADRTEFQLDILNTLPFGVL